MYCTSCGNTLGEFDTVCRACGKTVEPKTTLAYATPEGSATAGFAPREEKPAVVREKDDAINRIFNEDDDASARDRLEERRRKRAEEKSGGGFLSNRSTDAPPREERRAEEAVWEMPSVEMPPEEPAERPVYTMPDFYDEIPAAPEDSFLPGNSAPVIATELPYDPQIDDDAPRRNFRSEFVFGERQTQQPIPAAPANENLFVPDGVGVPPPAPELEPDYESFSIPVQSSYVDSTSEETVSSAPGPDDFFALKVDEADQVLFDINKKNEEFQELLDDEFERLRRGASVSSEAASLINNAPVLEQEPAPEILVSGDTSAPVENRVDDYLKKADADMLRELQTRNEQQLSEKDAPEAAHAAPAAPMPWDSAPMEATPWEQAHSLPDREAPSATQEEKFSVLDEMFGAPQQEQPPAQMFEATPIPPSDPGVVATRVPEPVEGFAFDNKDYGHALSHGAAPVSDIKTTASAYIDQAEEKIPEEEVILSQGVNLEFQEPVATEASSTYADLEVFDFSKDADPAPAVAPEPVVVAAPEPVIPTPVFEAAPAAPVVAPEPVVAAPEPVIPAPVFEAAPVAPVVAPEPVVAAPEPVIPAPVFEAAPAVAPEPVVETAPEPVIPAPVFEAAPAVAPEPVVETAPEPVIPAPVFEAAPAVAPEPVVETAPEPAIPAPIFETAPAVAPEPVVETVPEPVFTPEPVFEAAPEVTPEPAFTSEPVFEPEPEPLFASEPVFEAEPEVTPEPVVEAATEILPGIFTTPPAEEPEPAPAPTFDWSLGAKAEPVEEPAPAPAFDWSLGATTKPVEEPAPAPAFDWGLSTTTKPAAEPTPEPVPEPTPAWNSGATTEPAAEPIPEPTPAWDSGATTKPVEEPAPAPSFDWGLSTTTKPAEEPAPEPTPAWDFGTKTEPVVEAASISHDALAAFDSVTTEPETTPEPVPEVEPTPASTPSAWGHSAPTREQAAAFLQQPIDLPFDDNRPSASAKATATDNPYEQLETSFANLQTPDADKPAFDAPAFATAGTAAVIAETASSEFPASPLPAKSAAVSYDDALVAPTITGAPATPGEQSEIEPASPQEKKSKKKKSSGNLQRNVISVIITILIVILVLVIACIATLRFFPDGVIAYYILDLIETIQGKLSGG